MKTFLLVAVIVSLALTQSARSEFISEPDQLAEEGASFTWDEAKAKTVKILVESRNGEVKQRPADLGSGFLISADGLFVTAYHVMKYCLYEDKSEWRFATKLDCSTAHPLLGYKAQVGDRLYDIEILSFAREKDSVNGKETQTPDETIKHRDFVIGKLKGGRDVRFPYWKLADFTPGAVNLNNAGADFELVPLRPPKKVFVAGYPKRGFVISHGFLNLTENYRRGYFATDLDVYTAAYLKKQGIAPDTQWGIRVENHMSGGVVIDAAGYVVGLVVNGANLTAGVLSIENVLETFFSRSKSTGEGEGVVLNPTQTPLYLKTVTNLNF